MPYPTAKPEPDIRPADPLERGQFNDGKRVFTVCASSADAPDSFQVYAKGNRADVILIVSGLTTGNLHATWSDEWRGLSDDWREWVRANAFQVFYNGGSTGPARSRGVRFCDG
jgi:hypothetical protein